MSRKHYILGALAVLCLLGTGYYAWTLYDAHCKQMAAWNEEAKACFEEALWMEVNKRAEIPILSYSSGEQGMVTLNTRIPDSVSVMTGDGFRKYKVDREKYDNSLIKETGKRAHLGILFGKHPLSIDSLLANWNVILSKKHVYVRNQIRYIHTDLDLNNDTVFSTIEKQLPRLDSLTVKYLGFRCEHEITAYVSNTYWLFDITRMDGCILLLPWLLLVLFFIGYPKLEVWVQRKMTLEKIIETTIEVEKEVIVEKEIHVVDVQMGKVGVFQLPDGTVFDSIIGLLKKDVLQQRLQPQSISLLKLFLSNEDHQVSSEEICMKLWGDSGYSYRLHSAISRLRNDFKAVKSDILVSCSYGVYELKFPISSKISETD